MNHLKWSVLEKIRRNQVIRMLYDIAYFLSVKLNRALSIQSATKIQVVPDVKFVIIIFSVLLTNSGCTVKFTPGDGECGNGIMEGEELCDGDDFGEKNCSDFTIYEHGELICTEDCRLDLSQCHTCGNGKIEGSEECEGDNFAGASCESLGASGGTLSCSSECMLDLSECEGVCGNGIKEEDEECDRTDMGGADCVELGFSGGELSCLSNCAFDTSGCEVPAGCGNGIIEPGEECDDGNTQSGDGCSADCRIEPGYECIGEPSVCVSMNCGDGIIDDNEECDDGNNLTGDGCSDDCRTEPGWTCSGEPSNCTTICGDGIVVGDEECDDGNLQGGDGCSASCQTEPYFNCSGQPSECFCTVFVDGNVEQSNPNGSKWSAAYITVQEGIDQAREITLSPTVNSCEVWVTGSTYNIFQTSYNDTVSLSSNIALYGGFAGDETSREQRDWATNVTVLDGKSVSNPSIMVYHVVSANNLENSLIDGFTIKNGHSNRYGGGLYAEKSNLQIENCLFTQNFSEEGGGAYITESTVTFTECGFISNTSQKNGGGLMADEESTVIIESCVFDSNDSERGGGAYIADGTAVFRSCDFLSSFAEKEGGGIFSENTNLKIEEDCSFAENVALMGGAVYITSYNNTAEITNSTLGPDNYADEGGAIFLMESELLLSNLFLLGNTSDQSGGALHNEGTTTIENCVFAQNSSYQGGGLYASQGSSTLMINSLLYFNNAYDGGGVRISSGSFELANTIMRTNSPDQISHATTVIMVLRFSNIQGGFSGEEIFDEDPLFVDPSNLNFQLQSGSPCIDSADGDAAPEFDIDKNPRVDDPATENSGIGIPNYVDIGPYEFQP